MSMERIIRAVAGTFVLASLALGYWVHPGFFLFTAFVGANLLQSAFTGLCPLESILRRVGVGGADTQAGWNRRAGCRDRLGGSAYCCASARRCLTRATLRSYASSSSAAGSPHSRASSMVAARVSR